jgi:hypothetical protein
MFNKHLQICCDGSRGFGTVPSTRKKQAESRTIGSRSVERVEIPYRGYPYWPRRCFLNYPLTQHLRKHWCIRMKCRVSDIHWGFIPNIWSVHAVLWDVPPVLGYWGETQTWSINFPKHSDIKWYFIEASSLCFDMQSIVTVVHVYVAYFTALCGFFQGKHLTTLSTLCGPLCWRCWLPICSVYHFRRRKTFVMFCTPSDICLYISCIEFGPYIWQSVFSSCLFKQFLHERYNFKRSWESLVSKVTDFFIVKMSSLWLWNVYSSHFTNHIQLLCFWTLSVILFSFHTRNVSESEFSLRLQVEPTQLGQIARARLRIMFRNTEPPSHTFKF